MDDHYTHLSRRNFTKLSALGIGGIPFGSFASSMFSTNSPANLDIHIFSKQLQFLNYEEMSEAAADLGFQGIDLTVREKGHVLPEQVADKLPQAVAAMKHYGLNPALMTTNVLDVNNEAQMQVLKSASQSGFTHYRTAWLSYPEHRSITESQEIFAEQLRQLGAVNKELGLIGCYQNHAGNHVGAPIWDLPRILETANPAYLGCQYDIRHAVVEGGKSWELGLRLVHPLIKSLVIKDFKWGREGGRWTLINTPLGDGMVDFTRYFSLLKKYKIDVPISLHLEYDLGGAEHGADEITIDKSIIFKHMKQDLNFIRTHWDRAE
ncbi:sugar phosphate isomerase/epimerase family protein [Zeaxanthinibacter enoshimensis]|uniref:Sugar phosphate isomerase/epimerase n=1 Tax=Zeaxanthinibacter enoshimensis TaxID=392009 RepID=A0A4R6TRA8_9FLAO|nr:TIM barrel protein [Zeaxanthinibacter enoshimensis]TDQ32409.1 sugar phosphate isomerase/epimerase [Zeaxanthinibacter enoshimensis]